MRPILYTFRRCPYAIRARLAIWISGVEVEYCEVSPRDKPKALLDCSPKGTVPVIQFPDGRVIEESLEIMLWALSRHDPDQWSNDGALSDESKCLIERNDGEFKSALDYYKYSVRFPAHPACYYRQQAEFFLRKLNSRLQQYRYLMGDRITLADMAIFPFIRQFANVDRDWFYASAYSHLVQWLDELLGSSLFQSVMKK